MQSQLSVEFAGTTVTFGIYKCIRRAHSHFGDLQLHTQGPQPRWESTAAYAGPTATLGPYSSIRLAHSHVGDLRLHTQSPQPRWGSTAAYAEPTATLGHYSCIRRAHSHVGAIQLHIHYSRGKSWLNNTYIANVPWRDLLYCALFAP